MPLVANAILRSAASDVPGRLAVTLGGEGLTFGALARQANRMSHALLGLGVERGDRVAWWSDTSLDGVALYFGGSRVAATLAPLNPAYTDTEAAAVLGYLRPRLLVVDRGHAERGEQLAKDVDAALAVLDDDAVHGEGGAVPGADLRSILAGASGDEPAVPLPAEDDVCTIFLTSGSTGRPKGVMVSQRATWLRTHAGAAAHSVTGGPGEVIAFPLFHMAGWNFAGMAWSAHHTAHLVGRADADELLDAVERWSASTLYCIPAVWRRILESGRTTEGSSLEWALTGTSQVTVELLESIRARFPAAKTTINYGSTETARAVALHHTEVLTRPGSVGHPIPGVQARVATDGELLITSDRLMDGYFELPEETAVALRDGWYHTGDLAERDEDGYLTIVGRKKEVIRSGGETVAPVEVEAALAGFPGVMEVAVIGVPDAEWGEVVCAAVVLANGAPTPTVSHLRAHIGNRLASFKHPRRVIVVDTLPRTSATGQVQRSVLARQQEP